RSVLHGQQSDGRVPHVINIWGTSEWTQPPVLSWAASQLVEKSGDVAFVKDVYPKLRSYHAWLQANRKLSTGLYFWIHPYESGIDNSPRFGARDESKFIDTRSVESVDLSSYIVLDARALSALAKRLVSDGNPSAAEREELLSDIASFEADAERIAGLMREKLWDEKTGYFFDRDMKTGKHLDIPTIASFFPMIAKVATVSQAERLVEHLKNPKEFNTAIPFPTVARNHPTFEKDCWRGPIWINTAYLAIKGMKAYGHDALANEMATRLVSGVYKTWETTGKFVEYYDPERHDFKELTRKKGVGPFDFFSGSANFKKFLVHLFAKQMFLGTKPVSGFVGWTGLVNTIVEDELSLETATENAQ
ncbi:MAG: trehalase family glycosidase, partial [Bdellovibrionota bacterium]